MALYDDFLITTDYDGTLTDLNGFIPERNLQAILYFMENGGAFTINTGRSGAAARELMEQVPVNAPFILMNGAAMAQNGEYVVNHPIQLDPWSVIDQLRQAFPQLQLEVQDLHYHYLINPTPEKPARYDAVGWRYKIVQSGDPLGPFLKLSVYPPDQEFQELQASSSVHEDNPQLLKRIKAYLSDTWGDQFAFFQLSDQFMTVHDKAVSKLNAARELQKRLGKKYLVCIGDGLNDVPMLDGADFAYCPADGTVADRYETVCKCGDGAVADVIYKKIPEILGIQP